MVNNQFLYNNINNNNNKAQIFSNQIHAKAFFSIFLCDKTTHKL